MLHWKSGKSTELLYDSICHVLALSERDIGDIISAYSLAHGLLALNENVSSCYKNADDLSVEVDSILSGLITDGIMSTVCVDESIEYYKIERKFYSIN